MPKLKRISGEEAIKSLERLGFKQVRKRGSDVALKKQKTDEVIGCVVPLYRELAIGTPRGILKQAKLTVEEFMEDL